MATKKYYGKIKGINSSDNVFNLTVLLPGDNLINIKTPLEPNAFTLGVIYRFDVEEMPNNERVTINLLSHKKLSEIEDATEVDMAYRLFNSTCPYSMKELEEKINYYLNLIDNKILKDITKTIIDRNKELFYLYPAAQRFHHAYVGGLAYHTLGMLNLAKSMIENYSYLDKDYLYAGVILHDIGKVVEFSGVENTEYTLKGQLLGHLVMGSYDVFEVACELGYKDTEEAMLLEHMIISHHGQPMFGACKKPQTPEAIMLWYIDTLDSKFRLLGEELQTTSPGTFTEVLGVMDKTRVYKKRK